MRGNLKALLADKLNAEELNSLYKSYDLIGDIAVIRVPGALKKQSLIIAEAVMRTHKRIKVVWRQASPVLGDLRLRKLEWIAGERRTETIHREHGCCFKVDVEKCYFSPRLSFERMRVARAVQPEEVIVNMFSGVGCYSIVIAKHSNPNKILSIDINPDAVRCMQETVKLNKVEDKVVCRLGDAKKVIADGLQKRADRVLMPLPQKAYEYLDHALLALKPTGGWIHYYEFVHANKGEDPRETIKRKVSEKLQKVGVEFEAPFHRVVRRIGPNWFQIVLDLLLVAG